nr:MAG TPA: hypothetical protein [Caudoviricetes sp.]
MLLKIIRKVRNNIIMKKGIDISGHQGDINFDYIKDNYDFVIIRCGYGSDLSADDSECSQCDTMAQTYINECEARIIPYALYLYQYAADDEQARSEAAHIREWYNKSNPIGVFLDIEDADGYKERHGIDYYSTQALAVVWLDELADIKAKGIYASHSWLNTYMNVDELIEHGALIWEAHWNDDGEICDDKFAMSQESSDHHLDDGTRVDYDIMRDEVYNQLIGNTGNEDTSTEPDEVVDSTSTDTMYHEGDYVEYDRIYASSTSEEPLTPSAGFTSGTITRVIPGAANPYLINDGTGWVNDGCINSSDNGNQPSESDTSINVGDKVRVLVNATYDGGSFVMYYDTYDVIEVKGDRVVIGIVKDWNDDGSIGDYDVTCAINICNIERV